MRQLETNHLQRNVVSSLNFFWEASNVQSNPVGERLFRTQCLLGCASTASCRRESPAKYGCNKALLSIGSSVQQKTSLERFLSECLFKKLLLFRELLKPYSSSFWEKSCWDLMVIKLFWAWNLMVPKMWNKATPKVSENRSFTFQNWRFHEIQKTFKHTWHTSNNFSTQKSSFHPHKFHKTEMSQLDPTDSTFCTTS